MRTGLAEPAAATLGGAPPVVVHALVSSASAIAVATARPLRLRIILAPICQKVSSANYMAVSLPNGDHGIFVHGHGAHQQ
jgi:hypothetical protein